MRNYYAHAKGYCNNCHYCSFLHEVTVFGELEDAVASITQYQQDYGFSEELQKHIRESAHELLEIMEEK